MIFRMLLKQHFVIVMFCIMNLSNLEVLIQVTDSFAVPYTEKLEDLSVTINQEYFRTMYACHRRNNKKEVIVGWY